ncbi:MAG: PIN domain-containing protein [Candidatus Aenigmarchaeota archaeon]|nr:PIN domain-containing protein [Candidatus Aenigmarchaeota archaeon]
MSYKYVIDSSAWVEYFGGTRKGAKIRHIVDEEEIATSIIAIAELADKHTRENRPFEPTLEFVQSKAAILPITVDIAVDAARLKNDRRKINSKFGLVDGIHLVTAWKEQATLVTCDTDFVGVRNVVIVE